METDLNFKNFENHRPVEGDGGEVTPFSFPLSRQASIYSLTFDEFRNTVGGMGKDFGSMNMDEFLKNIWNAEENQNIGSISTGGGGQEGGEAGYLQRQGSFTIPRTLSLKTVDEVWQDMLEYGGGIDSNGGVVGSSGSQSQPTLGEITLEDFLAKAGVVRDEAHIAGNPNDPSNNWDFRFENQQENGDGDLNTINAGIAESKNLMAMQPANLPLNLNFGGQQEPLQLQQLLHSPTVVTSNGQLSNPGARDGILGITSPKMNNTGIQNTVLHGRGLGIHGFGNNGVGFSTGSPAISPDGLKGNGGMSSVSPTPYMFSALRGRKMAAVEKVLERRQRRMIKNREAAARSRARKQAYTRELEEEVAKLKEENQQLQKKQAGMRAILQKNLIREMTNVQQMNGNKRPCLRRTNTGPW